MLAKSLFRKSKKSLLLIAALIMASVLISFVLKRAGEIVSQEIDAEIAPSVWWDIVIQWTRPLDDRSVAAIKELVSASKWRFSQKVEMNYTLITPEWPLLSTLRWIDDAYPLYGEFEWNTDRWWTGANTVSLSKALYETYQAWSEDWSFSSISLQSQDFQISSSFDSSPGASFSVFDGGRTVVLALDRVEELGLLAQWTRVSHITALTLPDKKSIPVFKTIIKNIVADTPNRVTSIDESEWVFQWVGESLQWYLSLISLLFLLLQTCVLIFLGSRIVHENQDSLQIMRIYGLQDSKIRRQSLLWITWSAALWVWLWIAITYGLTHYLTATDRLSSSIWVLTPYIPTVIGTALLAIWVSALPIWLSVRKWPLSLLDSSPTPLSRLLSWKWILALALVILGSYRLIIGDLGTAWLHLGLVSLLALLVGVFVRWIHKGSFIAGTKAGRREKSFEKRDVLRFLTKPGTQSSLITGLCTILMILLSWVVMTYGWLQARLQWLTAWWDSIFVTNVFDDDVEKIDQLSFPIESVFDVILGRIVSINQTSMQDRLDQQFNGSPQQRWFTREFNMTSNPLDDVKIVSGKALSKEGEVSVDEDFANDLGLAIWDTLTISLAGREFDLTVINLRSSVRDGVRPFFYLQLFSEQFKEAPKTSFFQITAAPEEKTSIKSEITTLMGNNISYIDTGEIIQEVKSYISRIEKLLIFLFWLMLIYALGAIFSLFRYAGIFQKERFDVYELVWAAKEAIKKIKAGYISIYLLISSALTFVSFFAFSAIFANSTILEVSIEILWLWALAVLFVVGLVWFWLGRK